MLKGSFKLLGVATLIAAATSGRALAQNAMSSGPAGDIGVKLGDNTYLHAGVTAEAGWDTNVFYNDKPTDTNGVAQTPTSSAILQVIPSFLITNNGRDGKPQSPAVYTLGAKLLYREYLSNTASVRDQRAFIPSAVGTLALTGEKLKLALADTFSRTEEAPYREGDPSIKRDNNQGSAQLSISPGGGRITAALRYANAFDYFEGVDYKSASTMTHDGILDASWKWLPKTAIFIQGGGAYVHFLNPNAPGGMSSSAPRVDSVQVRGLAGLRGLLTPKTTVNVSLGYQTAFYQTPSTPPAGGVTYGNPNGISNFRALLDLGFIPTLLTRINLQLEHTFRNSPVLGNYYDVDQATLTVSHALGQLVLGVHSSFEYRRYQNYAYQSAPGVFTPTNRNDVVGITGASIDYYVQKWLFAGVAYNLVLTRPHNDPTAIAFTKQQIFAHVGVAY